jgi:hypothetical protein
LSEAKKQRTAEDDLDDDDDGPVEGDVIDGEPGEQDDAIIW